MSPVPQYRYVLPESELPTRWYNLVPDLPSPPPPPLHPGTLQPVGPDDLAPLFPMDLILQEVTTERYVDIPEEVREVYKLWRPSPLYRARRLEQALDTPAHIYYKYEGVSPAGSHKPNTAVAQAYYNKQEGVARLSTETGAGQWGSALSQACSFFGLQCKVYMVKVSYHQKPYRRILMETFGAQVVASPSLTKGKYAYDFGDTVGLTPLVKMHTLGHTFVPAPMHAGGLRYHGMAPLICKLYDEGVIEARAVPQNATFEAAVQFARAEGILPAPEAAHAVRGAIDEALQCRKEGKKKTIVFN